MNSPLEELGEAISRRVRAAWCVAVLLPAAGAALDLAHLTAGGTPWFVRSGALLDAFGACLGYRSPLSRGYQRIDLSNDPCTV